MKSMLSKLMPIMALVAAIALVAAACGGNDDGSTAGAATTAAPASEPGAPFRQVGTPASSTNEAVPGEIETAARKHLADELEVDEGSLKLNSAEGVTWSDASLGCPKEGMMYAQVITPGYKLVFELGGTSHAVHTNSDGSHVVVCVDRA